MTIIIFILESIFLVLGLIESLFFLIGFGIVALFSLCWGIAIQIYGAYEKNGESTYITAGFCLEVPLLSPIAGYFIFRMKKQEVGKYGI